MKTRLQALVATAVASMESDEATTDVAAVATAPFDTTDHDAAVNDAEEQHREVEASVNDVEVLEDAAQGLEAIIAALESLESPLTPREAVFMNIAAESNLVRLGMDMDDAPMIASFESDTGAASATKLSLDSIKAKLKAIWEAIKRVFAKVRDAVVSFYQRIVDANKHLEKRAVALLAAAKAASGEAKEKEISAKGLVEKIHLGGHTSSLATHFADLAFAMEQGMEIDEGLAKSMQENMQAGAEVFLADSDAAVEAGLQKVRHLLDAHHAPGTAMFPNKHVVNGTTEFATRELPGGATFVVVFQALDAKDDAIEAMNKHAKNLRIEQRAVKPAGALPETLPTLSLHDIQLIAVGAEKIGQDNAVFEACMKEAKNVFANMEKIAVNLYGGDKRPEALTEKGLARQSAYMKATSNVAQKGSSMLTPIAKYITRTALEFVAYAEKSLAQYGGAAKAEAAEDKKDEAAAAA